MNPPMPTPLSWSSCSCLLLSGCHFSHLSHVLDSAQQSWSFILAPAPDSFSSFSSFPFSVLWELLIMLAAVYDGDVKMLAELIRKDSGFKVNKAVNAEETVDRP